MGAMGVRQVAVMPDSYHLGEQAARALAGQQGVPMVTILEMPMTNQAADSEQAARLLQAQGAAAIIVLGGDGTSRIVSKGSGSVPLLPISTGTNNVLPTFVEGTVAGLAAGGLATGRMCRERVAMRHKWLQVVVNGAPRDRALVDAAVLRGRFVGTRAVWDVEDVRHIVVTRAHPGAIGMSAIAGVIRPIPVDEPVGLSLWLDGTATRRVLAPIGPGLIAQVGIAAVRELAIGDVVSIRAQEPLIVALDGEREVTLREGDDLAFVLRDDGPWIVDVSRAMEEMVALGMFDVSHINSEAGA